MHAAYFGIRKKIHPPKHKTAHVTRNYWRDRKEKSTGNDGNDAFHVKTSQSAKN